MFPWIRIILIIIAIGLIPRVVRKCLLMVITIITKHKLKAELQHKPDHKHNCIL